MSLNWNISEVKNHKEVATGNEWAITDILIWATMFVGLHSITAKNWPEFYARLHLIEQLNEPFLRRDRKPYYITPADVKRRIGLKTNAQTWGRAQFLKAKITSRLDEYSRDAEAAKEAA